MKTRIGLLLLGLAYGAGIVAGATPDIAKYPTCAVGCIIKALPESPCTGMNQTCLCADPVFNDNVGACLKTGCTVKEQLNVANLTWADCGYPLTDNTSLPRFLTGILFVLPTVFIVVRIANKWINPSPWAADDVSIIFGYGCTTALVPIIYRSLSLGLGRDLWTLQPESITEFLKASPRSRHIVFVSQIFYISGLCLIKASILFFYLRIFPSVRFRRVVWVTQGLNLLIAVLYLILTFTQCDPLPLYWLGWDGRQAGACRDFNKLVLSHVGFNMSLDIWMLALPLTQLYKLNMRLKKKIGIILMFSIGIFLTAVSAIRIKTLIHFATTNNITSEALWVYVWSLIELCVGVFVACMPSASQMWRSAYTQVKNMSTNGSTTSGFRSSGDMTPSPKRKINSHEISLVSTVDTPTSPTVQKNLVDI